jgi:hypothetical protein
MSGFWRRLFGRKDEFDFDDELAKLVAQMPPTATIPLPKRGHATDGDTEFSWPSLHRNAVVKTIAGRKSKKPKRKPKPRAKKHSRKAAAQ